MNSLRSIAAALTAVLALAACSSGTSSGPASGAAKTATTAAPASPSAAPALDASAVLARLKAAGLPISNEAVQDENTDPNNLLGRPNGYTSRVSFDVPGGSTDGEKYSIDRGGVIEVFPDAAGAKIRSDYIQGLLKGSPILGTEYHYQAGPVLLRITGGVKPSVAAKFRDALSKLD